MRMDEIRGMDWTLEGATVEPSRPGAKSGRLMGVKEVFPLVD